MILSIVSFIGTRTGFGRGKGEVYKGEDKKEEEIRKRLNHLKGEKEKDGTLVIGAVKQSSYDIKPGDEKGVVRNVEKVEKIVGIKRHE